MPKLLKHSTYLFCVSAMFEILNMFRNDKALLQKYLNGPVYEGFFIPA